MVIDLFESPLPTNQLTQQAESTCVQIFVFVQTKPDPSMVLDVLHVGPLCLFSVSGYQTGLTSPVLQALIQVGFSLLPVDGPF